MDVTQLATTMPPAWCASRVESSPLKASDGRGQIAIAFLKPKRTNLAEANCSFTNRSATKGNPVTSTLIPCFFVTAFWNTCVDVATLWLYTLVSLSSSCAESPSNATTSRLNIIESVMQQQNLPNLLESPDSLPFFDRRLSRWNREICRVFAGFFKLRCHPLLGVWKTKTNLKPLVFFDVWVKRLGDF